jgi:hypothetical protein
MIGDDVAATVGVHATPEVRVHHLRQKTKSEKSHLW